jgi:glycosyltransferase involved in cell wall biosynthesis
MRIGLYDPYLDTLSGGEKYILTMAACLSKNHETSILWDDPSILKKAYDKLRIDLSRVKIEQNIFSPKISLYKRLILSKKYDYLIILSDGSIPITLAKKTILHFQFPVEWVKKGDIKTKIKLSKINSVICNSIYTKKFIDKKFNINSTVLYPPTITEENISKLEKEKQDKKNIILTVGRYSLLPDGSSIKKQEKLLEIFKQMVDDGLKNWQFYLILSYLPENEKYISDLEAKAKNYPIKIIKNISYNELTKLYSQTKIYWHAAGFQENLEKYPERAEHFGITTVEAMAQKAVPVVINKGGQKEIVEDNINGFLWETEDELKQKTKRLMIDKKLREQMANLAVKKAKEFTTEKFCAQLHDVIARSEATRQSLLK